MSKALFSTVYEVRPGFTSQDKTLPGDSFSTGGFLIKHYRKVVLFVCQGTFFKMKFGSKFGCKGICID